MPIRWQRICIYTLFLARDKHTMDSHYLLSQNSTQSQAKRAKPVFTNVCANGRLLDDVCVLRYRTYLANNEIEANDTQRFFDEYDHDPHCQSYLTFSEGEIVGSIRSCVYQPSTDLCVPAMAAYESEIHKVFGLSQPFVEFDNLVMTPRALDIGGNHARLALMQNILNVAMTVRTSAIITAVQSEHVKHYRALSFKPISAPKRHPKLNYDCILLACFDITALRSIVLRYR